MDFNYPIIQPNLTTVSLEPENQETPIHFLPYWITPEKYFFLRNHFPYPTITPRSFFLPIIGQVEKPLVFHYNDLLHMPSKTLVLPLECSGNKRAYFQPKTFGPQWKDGAISQGAWRGVPLRYLLELTGIKHSAKEIVFEGYDCGKIEGLQGKYSFARSLQVKTALHPDILVAYELNGKPIPYKHGYPLRLIVPGWYAMASVKWLKCIKLINHQFQGPFQALDYFYFPKKDSDKGKTPVTLMKVNSIIQQPLDLSVLDPGTYNIHGIAWTGKGVIDRVEISTDNGKYWHKANLYHLRCQEYSWVFWTYRWNVNKKGEYIIKVCAKDSAGRVQPEKAEWNRDGYGYNAVTTIAVKIV